MIRAFARPAPLVLLLAFLTGIPVVMAAFRLVQIPLGALPEDSLRLAGVPLSLFLHSLGGVLFGVLGPLQFVLTIRRRWGMLHRLTGRVFVLAGVAMALAGLGLLFQVQSLSTGLLDAARGVFSLALMLALGMGVAAARARDMARHRAWMVRAYAIGMGPGTVALVMFPIYLITGAPVVGLVADIVFVGQWLTTMALAEWVIRRLSALQPTQLFAARYHPTAKFFATRKNNVQSCDGGVERP
ncbi:MAG: DUF2306 domain-containing protein [Hydrogenophaga sp.]|uniref:DUF2306 domain-containing protein n=1 Tax=Hydrogenophaga sp. TaxID=1904254 RepID=UPI002633A0E4|nr:DUF2306 domain-containing protein [Hydrogenophaga sp.]MDM7944538.1 DUF2306 domain-containing protein [Hydrogenophaga sp.]